MVDSKNLAIFLKPNREILFPQRHGVLVVWPRNQCLFRLSCKDSILHPLKLPMNLATLPRIVATSLILGMAHLPSEWEPGHLLFAQEATRQATYDARPRSPSEPFNPPDLPQGLTEEERVNIAVYEHVNRGVVNIFTKTVRLDALLKMEVVPAEGAGSGAVLDQQGHILTNHHVIADAQRIQVTLFDGHSYVAELIGEDAVNDIAVLKIDADPDTLYPIALGDSSKVRVGQKVYAVGNPFGLERTLTVGIVSSLNRTLPSRSGRTMKSIIQIDAALNRGNSGGPLIDSRAELIGMNTAIASSTGQNTGIGFAIPVNAVRRVVPQLIEHGRIIRPDIGITRVYPTERGLLIAVLVSDGPAEQAGLRGFRIVRQKRRRGPFVTTETYLDRSYADLIIAVDDQKIQTVDDLLSIVEQKQPNDKVTVTVVRDGQRANAVVVLGESE